MNAPKSLVLDLTKCQWATLSFKSNTGYSRPRMATLPTVHGVCFTPNEFHMTGCTMIEYATEHNLLDTWHPVCTFQLSANHTVTYTGDKALVMYNAWKAKVFSQALKKKKK